MFIIRVNLDPRDQHAAPETDSAMDLANPDRGSVIEAAYTDDEDPGAARLRQDLRFSRVSFRGNRPCLVCGGVLFHFRKVTCYGCAVTGHAAGGANA